MSNRLPIVGSDGRLWTWKPQTGYMPEHNAWENRAHRVQTLKAIRSKPKMNYGEYCHKAAIAANHICGLCGQKLKNVVTLDHVFPRALGGLDKDNLIAAHRHCNSIKSNRPPTGCELVFLAFVNARMEKLK